MFGNTSVYCPWVVVSYVSALLYDRNAKPKNYWRNTSGNGVIKEFIGKYRVCHKFETLMKGGAITEAISDELTYENLDETEQNLWSILLMTGYLTKADSLAEGETVALAISNAEIVGGAFRIRLPFIAGNGDAVIPYWCKQHDYTPFRQYQFPIFNPPSTTKVHENDVLLMSYGLN